MELRVEEDFLDPAFGIKYIGYPTAGLIIVGAALLPFSTRQALGVLIMALGYVTMGVGFAATVLYYRRLKHVA